MEAERRELVKEAKKGLSISDVILVGVLLAAGAVLKFFVGSIINFGMKPNFIIAMYCLAILLIKPKVYESVIIGVIAGAVCQFFPGTPYINFVSEIVGAAVMCITIMIPVFQIGKLNLRPVICTFVSTLASGFVFIGIMYLAFYGGADVTPAPLAIFLGIILGTAVINSVIVQLLYIPLKLALKKDN